MTTCGDYGFYVAITDLIPHLQYRYHGGVSMRIEWKAAVITASLAALASLASAPVNAENLSYSDLAARINALENELGSQQVTLASCESSSCCGAGTSSNCCKSSSWAVGYEAVALQPRISETGANREFSDDYGVGGRFILGYDGGSGMGARMRYMLYNHGHNYESGPAGSVGIDMDVLDFEVTLQEQLRNWNLMFSGGFRYAALGLNSGPLDTVRLDGYGVTGSLETTRAFGDRNLFLIGNFRASLISSDLGVSGRYSEDEIVTILENQLGVGYSRDLCQGTLVLKTVWETQFWLNDTMSNETGSNIGFSGPTTSVEYRF
jgi:hypothetical protein